MNTNPLKNKLRQRACELAVINGRSWKDAPESDWAQARLELTVSPEIDPQTTMLEAAPESERWDLVPGSTGHKALTLASADEDDGGRSANQQLVEEGVAKTEYDQMLQAGKAPKRNL